MAAPKKQPVLTELTVNYSIGMKANIGNYESADAHISKTERWNVEGLTVEEVEMFYSERYEALQVELGELIADKYVGFKNGTV